MFARKQLFHYFNVESKYGSIAYRLSLAFALNSSVCHVFDSSHCPLYKGISSEHYYIILIALLHLMDTMPI